MNQMQIFKNSKFGEVRVATTENGEPLFCLADVCNILGLQTNKVKERLNEKGWNTIPSLTNGGQQNIIFIDEPNFYKAVFQSRKAEAEQFQEWVTSEVLPSIRKHGAYMTSQVIEKALTDPDTLIQLATNLKEERKQKELLKEKLKIQEHVIRDSAPKVEYYENVLQSESLISTNIIAKDLGMSAMSLNRLLNKLGIIYRSGSTWVLYHRWQNFGYTKSRTYDYIDKSGVKQTAIHTYWTELGREFIVNQVNVYKEKHSRALSGNS